MLKPLHKREKVAIGLMAVVVFSSLAFIILFLLILHSKGALSQDNLQTFSYWIVFATAVYACLSLLDYIYSNRYYIAKLTGQATTASKTTSG